MIDKCSCGATCSQGEKLQAEIERLKGSQWISVKDRLPICAGGPVLVVMGTDVLEAYYSAACNAFTEIRNCQCCLGEKLCDVTHWQPLPEAPKEQGE